LTQVDQAGLTIGKSNKRVYIADPSTSNPLASACLIRLDLSSEANPSQHSRFLGQSKPGGGESLQALEWLNIVGENLVSFEAEGPFTRF
jgi:hypothetical protein